MKRASLAFLLAGPAAVYVVDNFLTGLSVLLGESDLVRRCPAFYAAPATLPSAIASPALLAGHSVTKITWLGIIAGAFLVLGFFATPAARPVQFSTASRQLFIICRGRFHRSFDDNNRVRIVVTNNK
jgi:hypothetical protein